MNNHINWNNLSLIVLFIATSLIYYIIPHPFMSRDYFSNALVAYTIVQDNSIFMNGFSQEIEKDQSRHIKNDIGLIQNTGYYAIESNERYVSMYPVSIPILAAPLVKIYTVGYPLNSISKINYALNASYFAAVILSALATCIMLIVLRKINEKTADYLIWTYALGTLLLPLGALLNNHLTGLIFLPIAWYFALNTDGTKASLNTGWAGLFSALAFAGRPTNIASYIVLLVYCIYAKKDVTKFLIASIPIFLLLGAYNYVAFGSPFDTGYNHIYTKPDGSVPSAWEFFSFDLSFANNFLGLLFSPNRGMFFFSPFLLFAFLGAYKAFKEDNELAEWVKFIFFAFLITVLLFSFWRFWTGAYRYGYTILLDILPYAMILISYASNEIFGNKKLLLAFALLFAISVPIAAIGVTYGCTWSTVPLDVDASQYRVWDIYDLQVTRCFKDVNLEWNNIQSNGVELWQNLDKY